MRILPFLIMLVTSSIAFSQEFSVPVKTQTIVADWDTSYKAISKTHADSESLALVIGKDTATLPDSLQIGDKLLKATFVKFDHIQAPCLEVIAERDGSFQYYILEVLPIEEGIPVSGKAIAIVDGSEFGSFEKSYFQLDKLHRIAALEIIKEDKNKDKRLDIGFKDTNTNKIYWLFWNQKDKRYKE